MNDAWRRAVDVLFTPLVAGANMRMSYLVLPCKLCERWPQQGRALSGSTACAAVWREANASVVAGV
jgi:hypothetical protein